jgi:hypothetical protein
MSHNLQRLGKLLIKPPTWDRSTPAAPPSADKSGETHPQGGKLFFESRARQNDRQQHCQLVPDQPLQDSQLFFGCWRSLRSCARGVPSTRRARPGKSSEEISDEGAPEKTFAGRRPRRNGGARGAGTGTYNPKDSSQKTVILELSLSRRDPAKN